MQPRVAHRGVREPGKRISELPATSAAVAAASAVTAAAPTTFPRLGFVHFQATTLHLVVVELSDRSLCRVRVGHLDEAEAARLAGKPVGDDVRRNHLPSLRKQIAELLRGDAEREISDIQLGTHLSSRGANPGRKTPQSKESVSAAEVGLRRET